MSVIAIIPARKGSKRIPGKNTIDFFGKPLIQYTIDAAVESGVFSEIIISTDQEDLQDLINTHNHSAKIWRRSAGLATDNASLMGVANEVLDKHPDKFEFVFILLPSTPMRTGTDIQNCWNILKEGKCKAVVSVSHFMFPFFYALHNKSGFVERLFQEQGLLNSQQHKKVFVDNGGIYGLEAGAVREHNFYPEPTLPYHMELWRSVDIDTPEDLELAKAFYSWFYLSKNDQPHSPLFPLSIN